MKYCLNIFDLPVRKQVKCAPGRIDCHGSPPCSLLLPGTCWSILSQPCLTLNTSSAPHFIIARSLKRLIEEVTFRLILRLPAHSIKAFSLSLQQTGPSSWRWRKKRKEKKTRCCWIDSSSLIKILYDPVETAFTIAVHFYICICDW